MRNHEIENWALDVINRVLRKQPIEDDRVELKADWPEASKSARRIAGHGNAARGEAILWLVGVDEAGSSVPGVNFGDLGSWYNSVKSGFDELAPEPVSLNIPAQGVTVAALYFETDRAPFVVKNPAGGAIQREVPWREATAVKSATRSQLLRLLSPLQKLPQIEVVGALVIAEPWKSADGDSFMKWEALLAVFLTQPARQQTTFSSHQCQIGFTFLTGRVIGPYTECEFRAERGSPIKASRYAVAIEGPGLFEVRTNYSIDWPNENEQLNEENVQVEITLRPAGHERSVTVQVQLPLNKDLTDKKRRWGRGTYSFSV